MSLVSINACVNVLKKSCCHFTPCTPYFAPWNLGPSPHPTNPIAVAWSKVCSFFPGSVWAKCSSNSGGPSSHLPIFTFSHLHTLTSSHPDIFTFSFSHLLIFAFFHFVFSHLPMFPSSQLHVFLISHFFILTFSHFLLIFTFSEHFRHIFLLSHLLHISHLHIFSSWSSYLHILPSRPFALLPSCPLALVPPLDFLSIFPSRRGPVPTRHHEMEPLRTKWVSIVKNWCKIAI